MFTNMGKNQSGQILIFVTLTLAISMIILPALLLFVGGAGRSAQIREDRMLQVYAADAGIEKALQQIVTQSGNWTGTANPVWEGNISNITALGFNENYVGIKVDKESEGIYRILSTATNWEGKSTTIECYTAEQDSWTLFDNALTSYGNITLKNKVEVEGNITLNEEKLGGGWDNEVVRPEGITYWPDSETLITYYQQDVGICTPPEIPVNLNITGNQTEGPMLNCGTLTIISTVDSLTLTLGGTIYSTGSILIGASNKDFTLDLGDQTIFCEGDITIGGKTNIVGSGCIVALGDVDFAPKSGTEPGKFVFIMSVNGSLTLQPSGDFYGSLAAYKEIEIKQGSGMGNNKLWVEWVDYDDIGFTPNFPTEDLVKLPAIITYTILDSPE